VLRDIEGLELVCIDLLYIESTVRALKYFCWDSFSIKDSATYYGLKKLFRRQSSAMP
jgi:hypothetical protein